MLVLGLFQVTWPVEDPSQTLTYLNHLKSLLKPVVITRVEDISKVYEWTSSQLLLFKSDLQPSADSLHTFNSSCIYSDHRDCPYKIRATQYTVFPADLSGEDMELSKKKSKRKKYEKGETAKGKQNEKRGLMSHYEHT